MAIAVFVLGVIVGILVLTFAYDNTETVTLHYLLAWQTRPIPLFMVILASVGVGFVIAGLFALAAHRRQRKTIRQQRQKITELETELHALRTLPIDAPPWTASGVATPADTSDRSRELSPR